MPTAPPLTVYEEAKRQCDDEGDLTAEMEAALEACGMSNLPTKADDKRKVGEALIEARGGLTANQAGGLPRPPADRF